MRTPVTPSARPSGGRAWVFGLAVLALALSGCVADPIGSVADDAEGTGGFDTGLDAFGGDGGGGAGGDGGPDMRDMDPQDAADGDAPPVDAEPVDMPIDEGTGGVPFDPCAEDDVMPGEPVVEPPTHAQAAVTRRGSETYFVWVDDAGALVSLEVGEDGLATGDPEVIELPDVRPERVVAREVGGYPWVAYGALDAPIVVFQVDLPGLTRIELDGLFGPPLIAAAGDGIMVFGHTADGALAWRRVTNDLDVEPLIVDAYGLDMPDDVAGVQAGVVMLFADAGQCVQISDVDWQPSGTFVCPTGDGRVISDGQRAIVSRVFTFGADQRIGVTGLYADTGNYSISFFETRAGTRFQGEGAERPVIGGRVIDGVRQISASVIGLNEAWDTVESWATTAEWPFDRTRALARRVLPDRVRQGTCTADADRGRCLRNADCDDGPCVGGVGADHLLALDFRADGRPRVCTYPMNRRSVGDPAYDIDTARGCIPQPEQCDRIDQDCDGRLDDGRCCEGNDTVRYTWTTPLPVATIQDGDGLRYEILVGDVELNNAYRVMYRLHDTTRWEGKVINLRQAPNAQPDAIQITFNNAIDGRFLLAAGGITGLVARHVEVEGGEPQWAIFMGHPSRGPDQFPPRPLALLDCTDVLAADTLTHRSPAGGNAAGEQFVVVCPDKIVRVHAIEGGENVVYPTAAYGIPEGGIGWATIERGESEVQILVGYEAEPGFWAVRNVQLDGNSDAAPTVTEQVPAEVLSSDPLARAWPIHRHPVFGRAPIQIIGDRSARLAFRTTDEGGSPITEWREVLLAPDPQRTVWSPRRFRIYSAGPVEPDPGFQSATGWWAADVTGNGGVYNLWSIEPVFVVQGEVATWYATGGSYGNDDQNLDIGRFDVAIITPTDDSDRNWRFITRESVCYGL